MLPPTSHAPAARAVGRRTLVLGTAWSAPAIVAVSAAPAFAASPVAAFNSCTAAGYTVLAFEASPTSSINPTYVSPGVAYAAAIPAVQTSVCYEVLAGGGGGGFASTAGNTGDGGDGAFSVGIIDGTASKTLGLVYGAGGVGAQKGAASSGRGAIGYGQGGRALSIDASPWGSGAGGGGSAILAGTTIASSTPLVVSGAGGGAGVPRMTSTYGSFVGGGGGDAGYDAQDGGNIVVTGTGTYPSYTLFAGGGAIGSAGGLYGRNPTLPGYGTDPGPLAGATNNFGGSGGALHQWGGQTGGGSGPTYGGGGGGGGGTNNGAGGGGGGGYAGGAGGNSVSLSQGVATTVSAGGGAGSSAIAGVLVDTFTAPTVAGYTVTGTVSTGFNHGVSSTGATSPAGSTGEVLGKGGNGYVKIYYKP